MKEALTLDAPEISEEDREGLIRIVAGQIWLPHPDVVRQFPSSVFLSARLNRKITSTLEPAKNHRGAMISMASESRVVLDDNTTPRWALLWAHGWQKSVRPRGWLCAHVWGEPGDAQNPNLYTRLANLLLIEESLAALTDKNGLFGPYLKRHAWEVYGFLPDGQTPQFDTPHYKSIDWEKRYLPPNDDAIGMVRERLEQWDNRRIRSILEIGWPHWSISEDASP